VIFAEAGAGVHIAGATRQKHAALTEAAAITGADGVADGALATTVTAAKNQKKLTQKINKRGR
jgi:hypothetical protein